MIGIEFPAVAALLAFFGFVILALFSGALVRGMLWRRKARITAALMPRIREALVACLAGSNDLTELQGLARTSRRDVADGILGFQGTVGGGTLDRLCGLAQELGLVSEWIEDTHSRDRERRHRAFARLAFVAAYEPCRRLFGDILLLALKDPDPEVRLSAARGVTESGSTEAIERVFQLAVSESLLARIQLAESLRRHALTLCANAVPEALGSPDDSSVLAALETLVAMERAIPFDHLRELLGHKDPRIRIEALRLAPFIPLVSDNRTAIVNALTDPDPEVTTVAALSAGRLGIEEAMPSLALLLRVAPAYVAHRAAAALADMPPRGWQTLEELSANASPITAAAAGDALARARKAGA